MEWSTEEEPLEDFRALLFATVEFIGLGLGFRV